MSFLLESHVLDCSARDRGGRSGRYWAVGHWRASERPRRIYTCGFCVHKLSAMAQRSKLSRARITRRRWPNPEPVASAATLARACRAEITAAWA